MKELTQERKKRRNREERKAEREKKGSPCHQFPSPAHSDGKPLRISLHVCLFLDPFFFLSSSVLVVALLLLFSFSSCVTSFFLSLPSLALPVCFQFSLSHGLGAFISVHPDRHEAYTIRKRELAQPDERERERERESGSKEGRKEGIDTAPFRGCSAKGEEGGGSGRLCSSSWPLCPSRLCGGRRSLPASRHALTPAKFYGVSVVVNWSR
mmetsp:Transcript_13102/g.25706  ORF Transcript_13102/g.25706 Transcript_13102/m.25706 type:complete len:210 (+) Transcript_13102:1405-2034(+)